MRPGSAEIVGLRSHSRLPGFAPRRQNHYLGQPQAHKTVQAVRRCSLAAHPTCSLMATDEKPVVRPAGGAIAASRVHGAKLGEPPPELATPAPGEPYTTFYGARRVFFLTLLIAIGVISPMTGSIYMPALPTISRDLHASTEHVQLTVTVYLIFQGLSPMFVGANTDKVGRRPVLILSQLLYLVVNIIIFVLPNGNGGYVGLMILRCVQAVGSASTISIGAVRSPPR